MKEPNFSLINGEEIPYSMAPTDILEHAVTGPPVAILIPSQQGPQVSSAWPVLGAENFCHRHEPMGVATQMPEQAGAEAVN